MPNTQQPTPARAPTFTRTLAFTLAPALLAATLTTAATTPTAAAAKADTKVTWLGHAAFQITTPAGTRLLVDPFISGNPSTPKNLKDLKAYKPNAILVSHSHGDHAGDTVAIAKQSGAKVVSSYEYVSGLKIPQEQQLGGNVGGTLAIGKDVTVHLVPAMHSSEPNGRPLGFVIAVKNGPTLYHTGDTWIFGDMALIQELHAPDVILLNTGGGPYTQNPTTAATAIKKYFKPKTIIPMHYGTFPPLAKEADVKAAFAGDRRVTILKPGHTHHL